MSETRSWAITLTATLAPTLRVIALTPWPPRSRTAAPCPRPTSQTARATGSTRRAAHRGSHGLCRAGTTGSAGVVGQSSRWYVPHNIGRSQTWSCPGSQAGAPKASRDHPASARKRFAGPSRRGLLVRRGCLFIRHLVTDHQRTLTVRVQRRAILGDLVERVRAIVCRVITIVVEVVVRAELPVHPLHEPRLPPRQQVALRLRPGDLRVRDHGRALVREDPGGHDPCLDVRERDAILRKKVTDDLLQLVTRRVADGPPRVWIRHQHAIRVARHAHELRGAVGRPLGG